MIALPALESLVRASARREPRAEGGCELCGAALGDAHDHVADLEERGMACACRACALLFERRGAGGGRYVTVPDRVLATREPPFGAGEAAALGIPVGLAFVFYSSRPGRWVAVYPSPAGPVESEPAPEPWRAIAARDPLVRQLEPDVEALLLHARRGRPIECLLVPISAGYQLVAGVRRHWRGFDGGEDAHREIDLHLARLRARSRVVDDGVRP